MDADGSIEICGVPSGGILGSAAVLLLLELFFGASEDGDEQATTIAVTLTRVTATATLY